MADTETKKRKANPAYAERKKRQKERVYTAVKTGVKKLCRDDGMYQLIQKCVWKASLIACEASLLTSFHILHLLEAGLPLPEMDYTFFNQCVSSIANLTSLRTCENRNPELVRSLAQYVELHPDGLQSVERLPCMTQMLVMIAQQAQENFAVSTDLTFRSRLARWFRLQIKLHSEATGTTYFTEHESKVIKSVVSVLTRASTEEPYSVAGLIARYTRFQPDQFPIPEEQIVWMQSLCDEVRGRIGPLPLGVKKNPQDYLPFLHSILRDLEAFNQGQMMIPNEGDERPASFKLFSLLPQKKVRPINIKINNTVLADMHKYLKTDLPLEGREVWDYYFNTRLVSRSERKEFEEFMVTDGLSASLIVSRPKLVTEEVAASQTERKRAQELLESASRVVAVDPGRNPIFTAVVHDQYAMDSLQSHNPYNVKHEVIKWSKRRFYQEAGYTHRNRLTKLWTSRAPLINTFNAEVLTAKTSSLEFFKAHARHVLANMESLMAFYSAQRFKRLRWKTYISRQKAYEKLVSSLQLEIRTRWWCGETPAFRLLDEGVRRYLHLDCARRWVRGSLHWTMTNSALPSCPPAVTPSCRVYRTLRPARVPGSYAFVKTTHALVESGSETCQRRSTFCTCSWSSRGESGGRRRSGGEEMWTRMRRTQNMLQ